MKISGLIGSFFAGVVMALLGGVLLQPVQAAPIDAVDQIEAQCFECTVLPAKVKLSHYNPNLYDQMRPQLNCWDYSEEHRWCLSPVWIGVPWESGFGFFAACPDTWAIGTWVRIPDVGSYLCMDHGYDVKCDDKGICNVDVLRSGSSWWDGKMFDASLMVPRSFLLRYQRSQEEDQ